MINLGKVDLVKFVKDVYSLSVPQGMGFLHARDGELSDEDANSVIEKTASERQAVGMDYVHGRACKMNVHRDIESGELSIKDSWYDHTDDQLNELLSRHGLKRNS